MKLLSHPAASLSIAIAVAVGAATITALTSSTPAYSTIKSNIGQSPYYGRWTVNGNDTFSARGRQYKTIDIAPCGKDFCGISVADNGSCGVTLFRFLGSHSDGKTRLKGHAKWGVQTKNVTIAAFTDSEFPGGRGLDLNLGDGYNFSERDGNMPKFYGLYQRTGGASCKTR